MKDKEFAVVDIGSNSLRLMTGRWEDDSDRRDKAFIAGRD